MSGEAHGSDGGGADRDGRAAPDRERAVGHALRLEYLTVGWNVVEGLVAVAAAAAAGSVALLGFGIDSFVESASGGVLVWRLLAERRGADAAQVDRIDARAHRLVGASLFLLAAYVAWEAAAALWSHEVPRPSPVGMALTAVSIVVMRWLAGAKRRAARRLGSRALEADAFQTTACFWLSIITLAGVGLNAALGWWWADPAAALGMTVFIAREGLEAWRGEGCGCEGELAELARGEGAACGCGAGTCGGAEPSGADRGRVAPGRDETSASG